MEPTMHKPSTKEKWAYVNLPRSFSGQFGGSYQSETYKVASRPGDSAATLRRRAQQSREEADMRHHKYAASRTLGQLTFNLSRYMSPGIREFEDQFYRDRPEDAGGAEAAAFATTLAVWPTKLGIPLRFVATKGAQFGMGLMRGFTRKAGPAFRSTMRMLRQPLRGAHILDRMDKVGTATHGAAATGTGMWGWVAKKFGESALKSVRPADVGRVERLIQRVGGRVLEDGSVYIPLLTSPSGRKMAQKAVDGVKSIRVASRSSKLVKVLRSVPPTERLEAMAQIGRAARFGETTGRMASMAQGAAVWGGAGGALYGTSTLTQATLGADYERAHARQVAGVSMDDKMHPALGTAAGVTWNTLVGAGMMAPLGAGGALVAQTFRPFGSPNAPKVADRSTPKPGPRTVRTSYLHMEPEMMSKVLQWESVRWFRNQFGRHPWELSPVEFDALKSKYMSHFDIADAATRLELYETFQQVRQLRNQTPAPGPGGDVNAPGAQGTPEAPSSP
jgi:hypothetical protein